MLALFPRFFAESFYNNKDIIFLASMVIGMAALQLFLEKRTFRNAVWLAFTAAYATDVRILGILLPFAATAIMVWEQFTSGKDRNPVFREIKLIVVLMVTFTGLTILMWPFLWSDPAGHFAFAFRNMSKYRWTGSVPFRGVEVNARNLPPYYLPLWMGITLPLFYIVAGITGIAGVIVRTVKIGFRLYKNQQQRFDLICLILFLIPPVAAITLGSIMYNGWRHMYFICGPLFMLAISGLHTLSKSFKNVKAGYILPGLMSLQLAANVVAIFWLHPFQNVYFNVLAGKDHAVRYEVDYWGLSYRNALEYIAENDPSDSLQVRSYSCTGELSHAFLSPEDKQRITVLLTDSLAAVRLPDYHITDMQWKDPGARGVTLVHEVKAGSQTINWVYKRSVPQIAPAPATQDRDTIKTDSLP
jgi:hypothetical protein